MKITQAIKLGHRNIIGHKRRHLTTIIIVGVMFGFLSGVIFLTQGVQNAVRKAGDAALGDDYYVSIQTDFWNENICHYEPIPDHPDSYNIICNGHDMEALERKVAALGGEIIASTQDRSLAIPPEAVQSFTRMDLADVPDTEVPVLDNLPNLYYYKTEGQGNYYNLTYSDYAAMVRSGAVEDFVGFTYNYPQGNGETSTVKVAGILPTGNIRQLHQSNSVSLNPLDYILDFVGMQSSMGGGTMIINNGSPATEELLTALNSSDPIAFNMLSAILKFDSFEHARQFVDENACPIYEDSMGCKKEFFLESKLDNRVALAETGDFVWMLLGIAEIVLLVFAVIITLFTLLKVMHGEKKTIALYRSLGASTGDIIMIYLAYMLEVCLLAVGFALVLGLVFALIISLANSVNMNDMLTAAYLKPVDGLTLLVGWNSDILKIVVVMLCVAPVSLLLCGNMLRKR